MSVYQERLQRVRRRMLEQDVELLVLTPSPFMFYVTGIRHEPWFGTLKGPGDWLNAVFIGLDGDPVLAIHWMVQRLLARQSPVIGDVVGETRVIEHGTDPFLLLESILAGFNLRQKRIAVADRTWAQFTEALRAAVPDGHISLASRLMDDLLAVKDEHALGQMRQAAAITDAAYREVLKVLRPGVTEAEVALEVDCQLRRLGAEGNSFKTSVVFMRPGDLPPIPEKHLQPGDSVMFDFGCVYGGYCSDFGRSAFVGDPPPEYLHLHEMILCAQAEGMRAMKPGKARCEEVVSAVHRVLSEGGYGANLIPQTGHGIGITVHEVPLLLRGDKTVLELGMVFTVEPTLRVPGRFCNRVEDVILVTGGEPTYLTNHPRTLHIVQ